jgi:hypothetical protein
MRATCATDILLYNIPFKDVADDENHESHHYIVLSILVQLPPP